MAHENLGKLLKKFYQDRFKPDYIFKVVNPERFAYREFGFDILGSHFVRNRSFSEPAHLHEYLYTFPVAGAYIGAEYEFPLRGTFGGHQPITIHDVKWIGRELVFDLDANEYDPVRFCSCKGQKKVCEECWPLMQDAAAIIDETLRKDFGFKKIVWVFTGGRGYHCWVLDKEAYSLTQEQRSGIVSYMQLIHDPLGEQRIEDISSGAERLKERIFRLLGKQFVLNTPEKVFAEINIKKTAYKRMVTTLTQGSYSRFIDVVPKNHEAFLGMLIKYRYPRIDHKVTIDTKRLIRLPGTIHSRTGFIVQYVDDPVSFTLDQAIHFETEL